MHRNGRILAAAITALIVTGLGVGAAPAAAGQAGAGQAATAERLGPAATAGSVGGAMRQPSVTAPPVARTCATPAANKYGCVATTAPNAGGKPVADDPSVTAVPIPDWCNQSGVWGIRTQVCDLFGISYTTYRIQNGSTIITGEIRFNAWDYSYTSTSTSNWGNQFSIASYWGWGDAMSTFVSGTARPGSGSCTLSSSSFPSQSALPHYTMRHGESFYNTTATAVGAVGFCTTTWDVFFRASGYPGAVLSRSMFDVRCDNATGANGFRPARVGCVVYWYASAATYSQSANPTLASHVSQAQGSGLPGATFATALVRTTNQAIIDQNRNLACGSAPSIPGLSCDEYPLASSRQGLSSGGSLRTFDGCNINAPRATGPTGASACMINASDNSAQGGIMAAFNYDERVLDGDRFRVIVTA